MRAFLWMIFMTIQIPNPGTGNGATGDNEFALWSKVKGNFEDQANAASRTVGTEGQQVPLASQVFRAAFSLIPQLIDVAAPAYDVDSLQVGSWVNLNSGQALTEFINAPFNSFPQIMTFKGRNLTKIQIAFSYTGINEVWVRHTDYAGAYQQWVPMTPTALTYQTTTASGANVVVDSTGKLMRSTSSERYKDILADLVLDDTAYANAMQLAPIVYRSTADADNPAYHYYSFSAEALGAFDPAFTLWRETETVTDDEGNTTEQPLDERVAEGININALLAFSHAIAIKQDKMIKTQSEAITTLTQRIDAMKDQ